MTQGYSFLINYPKEYTICILFFLCSLTYSLICSHVHTPALTPVRITIVSLFFPCFVCSSYLITFLAPATDAPVFDLSGRRVVKVVKGGLYIQNGKKFIVK